MRISCKWEAQLSAQRRNCGTTVAQCPREEGLSIWDVFEPGSSPFMNCLMHWPDGNSNYNDAAVESWGRNQIWSNWTAMKRWFQHLFVSETETNRYDESVADGILSDYICAQTAKAVMNKPDFFRSRDTCNGIITMMNDEMLHLQTESKSVKADWIRILTACYV